jgi:hypothetical protein
MGRTTAATVVAALFVGGFVAARAQTEDASQSPGIMPALLTEVRGLRAAMEQMASSGARVQLTLGRLQLQEQRLNTTIKRLDETRTRLAELQRSAADQQDQVAMFETMFKEAGTGGIAIHGQADGPDAKQVEMMIKEHKRGMARTAAEIQRLTAEEATLTTDVASEQARWTEINQRLEELERALSRR